MADLAWPSLARSVARVLRWEVIAPAEAFRSPLDGTLQTGASQGPRWGASVNVRVMAEADAVELQAFAAKLRGKANRVLLPYLGRLVPRGTINTSGVTVNGALALGATQATLAGCGNAKTLLTGDWMSIGGQLLMMVDGPYTSTAGGAMANVKFEHPLRAAVSDAAAVTLSSPTCRMVCTGLLGWETRAPTLTEFAGFEFEEDPA